MIEFFDVKFRYEAGLPRGVGPLSVSIEQGERLGVLGPSGCGKTTFLRLVSGLLPGSPHSTLEGRITNTVLSANTPGVSFMFQQATLLPQKTVLANVMFPLYADRQQRTVEERAVGLLDSVGLRDALNLLPGQLSGGMRTRVAMARALITKPSLLLLDEPFSGLDIAARDAAYRVIDKEATSAGTTVILVTHDVEEAWRMCSRVITLRSDGALGPSVTGIDCLTLDAFRDDLLAAFGAAT